MQYTFNVNGQIKLTIKPENNIEREIFKELFSANVDIKATTDSSNTGEITISKVEDKPAKPMMRFG